MFVAYADAKGGNEFLIRDDKNYFVMLSNQKVISISAKDAIRTLNLIKNGVLTFRGKGVLRSKIKTTKGENQ